MQINEKVTQFSESIARIKKERARDVVGQADIIDNVIIAIVAAIASSFVFYQRRD